MSMSEIVKRALTEGGQWRFTTHEGNVTLLQTVYILYLYCDSTAAGFVIFSFLSISFASSWKAKLKIKVGAHKHSSVLNRLLKKDSFTTAYKEEDEFAQCNGTQWFLQVVVEQEKIHNLALTLWIGSIQSENRHLPGFIIHSEFSGFDVSNKHKQRSYKVPLKIVVVWLLERRGNGNLWLLCECIYTASPLLTCFIWMI